MTITLDRANAVTTITQSKSLVGRAADEWKAGDEKITGINSGRTLSAAYATHAAIRTGYLGAGRDLPNGAVNGTEYAALFGVSSGLVSAWRTLARAFVDLGVSPESYAGKVLLSGKAGDKAISAAVKADGATEATITEALRAAGYDERGKITREDGSTTATGKRAAGGKADQTDKGEGVAVPRNDSTRLDLIETTLAAMSKRPGKAERERFAALAGAWCATWGVTPEGFAPVTEDAEQPAA